MSPRDRRPLRSGIAWSSADRIVVRGHDLTRLIGSIGLGEMAFLELMGRLPEPEESTMFNALCVTLVEHGLTPSAMATRLTIYGAPESLQGAVAAGRILPINATGAMGAIASDMGIPWRTCRGLAVMARAIGLVAHVQEELAEPLAPEVMARVDDDAEIRTD